MQAYCMKCRTKREMKDAKTITMKNGKVFAKLWASQSLSMMSASRIGFHD